MRTSRAIATLLVGLVVAATAHSQVSGSSNMAVSLTGQLAILSYHDQIQVTIPVALLAPLGCTGAGNYFACPRTAIPSTVTATMSGGELSATYGAAIVGAPPNTPFPLGPLGLLAVPLRLQEVWSVRSIGGSSGVSVVRARSSLGLSAISGPITLSQGPSQLGVTPLALRTSGGGVTINNLPTIIFTDTGLVNARSGSVLLGLNFTNTTRTGTHVRAGGEYRLTLTNL